MVSLSLFHFRVEKQVKEMVPGDDPKILSLFHASIRTLLKIFNVTGMAGTISEMIQSTSIDDLKIYLKTEPIDNPTDIHRQPETPIEDLRHSYFRHPLTTSSTH